MHVFDDLARGTALVFIVSRTDEGRFDLITSILLPERAIGDGLRIITVVVGSGVVHTVTDPFQYPYTTLILCILRFIHYLEGDRLIDLRCTSDSDAVICDAGALCRQLDGRRPRTWFIEILSCFLMKT